MREGGGEEENLVKSTQGRTWSLGLAFTALGAQDLQTRFSGAM